MNEPNSIGRMFRVGLLVLIAYFAFAGWSGAAQPTRYNIEELSTLGGLFANALSVNESGEVVGYADDTGFNSHAMYWFGGQATIIGPGMATSINKHSHIVGSTIHGVYGAPPSTWTIWSWTPGGVLTPLPMLPDAIGAVPWSINDHGDIVGWAWTADGYIKGFVIRDGVVSEVGLPGYSYTQATAINNAGDIAGFSNSDPGGIDSHAFVISRTGVVTEIVDSQYPTSTANAMNAKGVVVGVLSPSQNNVPYVWDSVNGVRYLSPYGQMYGINDHGDMVGGVAIVRGEVLDLLSVIQPETPWDALIGYTISNKGSIAGLGYRSDACPGQCRSIPFLMTPVHGQ